MDWYVYIIAVVFIIVGTFCVFFIGRFERWWGRFVYENDLSLLTRQYKDQGLSYDEYRSRIRYFLLLWRWLARVMGAMLAIAGVFLLVAIINQ